MVEDNGLRKEVYLVPDNGLRKGGIWCRTMACERGVFGAGQWLARGGYLVPDNLVEDNGSREVGYFVAGNALKKGGYLVEDNGTGY